MPTSKRLSILFLAVLMSASLLFSGCSQQGSQPGTTESSSDNISGVQTLSDADSDNELIDISISVDPEQAEGVLDDDDATTPYGPELFSLATGSTAYDALVATGLQIEGSPSYVASINGLAVGTTGPLSGWMYYVNGESPSVSADQYVLEDGDEVEWRFVAEWE